MTVDEKEIERIAKEYKDYKFERESDIQAGVVPELLKALGWTFRDDWVTEYKINIGTKGDLRADFKVGTKEEGFLLEVKNDISNKKLREDNINQLKSYMKQTDYRYGVLYNVREMMVYNSSNPEKEPVLTWKIGEEIAPFRYLGKDNFPQPLEEHINERDNESKIDIAFKEKKERMREKITKAISNVSGATENYVEKHLDDFLLKIGSKEVEDKMETLEETLDVYNESKKRERFMPHKLVILNEEIENVNHVKDVLIQTAEWLIQQGKLDKNKMPIMSGLKRCIVNSEKVHNSGINFLSPEKLSNGLYIETHDPHEAIEKYARKLMTTSGYKESDIKIEWKKFTE